MLRLIASALFALLVLNPVFAGDATPGKPSGSLTLVTGGTAQVLFTAGEAVSGCTIQNPPNATEPISVNFGAETAASAATGGTTSVSLAPGVSIGCGDRKITTAITWVAATTGHAINAWKF